MVIYRYISNTNVLCSIHCKRMSYLNVESYVFINVFYLVLFCIHICVDDVIKKKKKVKVKLALAIPTGAPVILVNEIIDTSPIVALKTIKILSI